MWIDLMRTASDLKSATAYTAELSVSSQKFSGKDHRKLSMHASASLQCRRVGCNGQVLILLNYPETHRHCLLWLDTRPAKDELPTAMW